MLIKTRGLLFTWGYLMRFLFYITIGLFIVSWFIKISDYLVVSSYILLFLAYLLSERIFHQNISLDEKVFCYSAIHLFFGFILISLVKNSILKTIWVPIAYLIVLIGLILVYVFYFIKQVWDTPGRRWRTLAFSIFGAIGSFTVFTTILMLLTIKR